MATDGTETEQIPAKLSRPRRCSAELASRTWVSQKAEKKTKEKKVSTRVFMSKFDEKTTYFSASLSNSTA